MTSLVHYDRCPLCNSYEIHPLLSVKDYSVSGETFVIWICSDCSLRFTQDVPAEQEMSRYYKSEDYISHTNTNKGLVNRLYLAVRNITLKIKAGVIQKQTTLENGRLLDVGAGAGAFLHHMQQKGWEVTGIEPDADARNVARQVFDLSLEPYEVFKKLPLQSFDAITLWHVLEHVHQLHAYMDILKSLLKPGGKIIIAVPNYRSLDAGMYRLAWAAYDVPRHLYHFSPKAMQTLVQHHGLTIEAQVPMWFDAFYISLLSSKYKKGRTNWLSALGRGALSNLNAFFKKEQCSSLIYVIGR